MTYSYSEFIFFNFRIHASPVVVDLRRHFLKRSRDQNDAASVPIPPAKRPKLSYNLSARLRGLPPRQLERVRQRIAEKKRRLQTLQLAQGRLPSYYVHTFLFGGALNPLPPATPAPVPVPTSPPGTRVVWKRSGKNFTGTEIISVDREAQTDAPVNMDTNHQKRPRDTVLPDCEENKDVDDEEHSALSVKRHKPSVRAYTLPMKTRAPQIAKKNKPKRIQIRRLSRNSKLPAAGVSDSAATPWVPPELPDTPSSSRSVDTQVKTTHAEADSSTTTTSAIKPILKNHSVGPKAEAVLDSDVKTAVPMHTGKKRVRFLLQPDGHSAPLTKRERSTVQEVENEAAMNKRRGILDTQAHAPALKGAKESAGQKAHSGSDSEPDSEGRGSDLESVSHSEESESESRSGGSESDGPASKSGTDSSGDSSGEKEVVKGKLEMKLPQKQITATSNPVSLISDVIKTSTTNDFEAKNLSPKLECTESAPTNVSKAPGSNSPSTPAASGSKKSCITIEQLISLFCSKLSFASAMATANPGPDYNPFKLHLKKRHALKCTSVSHQCVRLIKS